MSKYHYNLVADVEEPEMPRILKDYMANTKMYYEQDKYHALYSSEENLTQVAFFTQGRAELENLWIETFLENPLVVDAQRVLPPCGGSN